MFITRVKKIVIFILKIHKIDGKSHQIEVFFKFYMYDLNHMIFLKKSSDLNRDLNHDLNHLI